MIVVYLTSSHPTPAEEAAFKVLDAPVVRNGNFFRGVGEERPSQVYSDRASIRTAYEAVGVEAKPLTTAAPKKEPGKPVRFESAGGWYTAYDADGNEVGKVQGGDKFFAKHPHLKPGDA